MPNESKLKETERQRMIEALEIQDELERRQKADPLKYVKEHPKQLEASRTNKMLRCLFWGNRCGKTEWGAMEAARVLLGRHPFIPQGEIWSGCPSYDAQEETTQKKLLTYLPKDRILDISYLRKNIIKTIFVRADDGRATKLTFKSYEQGREKFQGAGKVLIWFDEEPPKDIYDECFVRQDAGQVLFINMTMTPIKGMTWVYNNIYLNTSSPDIFVSKAGWKDNPYLTKEQIDLMSRNLTEAALKVRRDGDFVKMTGLVCSWFDRTIHVIDMKDKVPPGDTYLGMDFGFSAPTAGLYVRIDREFNLWIFDGFYRRGLTNPDIQTLIKLKENGINGIIKRVGDSAQASDIKQLNDAKIDIVGVSKVPGDTKQSWDEWRAQKMEEYGRLQLSNQKPKIFISKDLVEIDDNGEPFNFLVRELENLRWEEVKTTDGMEQRPIWGKQANHAIDALTYIIATMVLPLEPKTKFRQNESEPISEFYGGQ